MRASFETYWPLLLEVEGGFSVERTDPGNWTGGKIGVGKLQGTKYGIASHVYPHLDIPNLTQADAKAIYLRDYMPKTGFDRLQAGVDVVVGDYGINSGPARAVKDLQRTVGASADGEIGEETFAKANARPGDEVISGVTDRRMGFLKGITSMWATYGKGWSRRVAQIEAMGVKLYLASVREHPAEIRAEMASVAVKHDEKAATAATAAGGVTAAGTGSTVITNSATDNLPDFAGMPPKALVVAVIIAVIVGAGFFLWRRHAESMRAQAFKAAAVN